MIPHEEAAPSTAPTTLRVLSANLFGDRVDGDAFAALLVEKRIDVAAVQELTNDAAGAIAQVLGHGLLQPASDSTGMGIALRTPGVVQAVPLPYCAAQSVVITAPGGGAAIEVMNVHFSNPLRQPMWRTAYERRTQVEAVETWLGRDAPPRVVVGDLNSSPLWPAYRRLARSARDLMRSNPPAGKARPVPTWSPRADDRRRLLRIDHVFGIGVRTVRTEVLRIAGSDHSAILCEIEPITRPSRRKADRPHEA